MIQPGDILFWKVTPKSSLIARLIGAGQLLAREGRGTTLYSHVSIVESDGVHIEAVFPWIRSGLFNQKDPRIEVWRVIDATPEQAASAVRAARSHIGEWYSLSSLLFGLFHNGQRNCAILMNDSWVAAGLPLWRQSDRFLTPNDLSQSDRLMRVS